MFSDRWENHTTTLEFKPNIPRPKPIDPLTANFTHYLVFQYTDKIVEFMLSKGQRLANIDELAAYLKILTIDDFKEKGLFKVEPNPEDTLSNILLGKIIGLVSYHEAAKHIYQKMYDEAILKRVVDVNNINEDILSEMEKAYERAEDGFFADKNLKIIFERIANYS